MRKILFFLFVGFFALARGSLKCYTCSTTEDDLDDICVSKPTEDSIRNCNKKYCNIIRVEYLDPKGKIASMSRGCSDEYLDGISEDKTHRIYQVSCNNDLCNSGSGKDGGKNKKYIGDKSTIYCPGVGLNSAYEMAASLFICTLSLAILMLN